MKRRAAVRKIKPRPGPMGKVYVEHLAYELGLSNKELIVIMRELGIEARSQKTAIAPQDVNLIRNHVSGDEMDSKAESPYEMTLSLNVLNHLGINLYSNIPAVLSEVVANAWDADAESVTIEIDREKDVIVIQDDGHGMTKEDVNNKFLNVGYERREEVPLTPKFGRFVMGRKGIGKLSLFSIAKDIKVFTIKEGVKSALQMNLKEIKKVIRDGESTYHPDEIEFDDSVKSGTKIILNDLKKQLMRTPAALRQRLARRFSIIGEKYNFAVSIDGEPVAIDDRNYYHKVQYLWHYGDSEGEYKARCKNLAKDEERENVTKSGHKVKGWIASVEKSGDLKGAGGEDNLNKIVVMVRGKLAQEDMLEDFGEGGLYSKYLMGEIHADFLDLDDLSDIATTSRQRIFEEDPRYIELKKFVEAELKHIQSKWTSYRNEEGTQRALEIPGIKEWFEELPSRDIKKKASSLFGKINQLTVENEGRRRMLYKHGVLAFENLRAKDHLDMLENVSPDDIETLTTVISAYDDVEASFYHQIAKNRIEIIEKLQKAVEANALEKVLQQIIFDHLWLLDPSWERASTSEYMERSVKDEFDKITNRLTEEEKKGRLDIKYRKTSGKHVIVELKRAERVCTTFELSDQMSKYLSALERTLRDLGDDPHPDIECVCLLGVPPSDWKREGGRERSRNTLKSAANARVVMYQELLHNAHKQYREYLEAHEQSGRLTQLMGNIEGDEEDEE